MSSVRKLDCLFSNRTRAPFSQDCQSVVRLHAWSSGETTTQSLDRHEEGEAVALRGFKASCPKPHSKISWGVSGLSYSFLSSAC